MKRTALIVLFCAVNCVTRTPAGGDAFSYTDGESFRVTIPLGNKDVNKTAADSASSYEFREKPSEDSVVVRITVQNVKSADDLFAPRYEGSYLSQCNCSVVKRGVIHVDSWAAREYVLSMKDNSRTGHERHIAIDKKIFILSVIGPSDEDARLTSMFKTLTDSFAVRE